MKININGVMVEVDAEALKTAIDEQKESFDVTNDALIVRDKADYETFVNNLKAEEKRKGEEIGRKELFQKLDLDIEGTGAHKSVDKSIEFINGWTDKLKTEAVNEAKVEPDKKVQQLQSDLETAKGTIQSLTGEKTDLQSKFDNYKKDVTVKTTLSSHIPDNISIPKDDMLMILGSRVKTGFDDNGNLVALDAQGNIKKDPTTLNPVSLKDEIKGFFDNNPNYLKAAQGGSGGGDSGGGSGKQTLDDFTKEMSDAGHAPNSESFNEIMNERIKNGTLEI